MPASEQSVVIGVFDDPASANRSLLALQEAGFSKDQIRRTIDEKNEPETHRGIRGLFSGENATTHKNVMNDLIAMGVDPQDAKIYQKEYEAGHPLVSVTGTGNMQKAINVLHEQGAHAPADLERRETDSRVSGGAAARSGETGATRASTSRERTGNVDASRTGDRTVNRTGTRSDASATASDRTVERSGVRADASSIAGDRTVDRTGTRLDASATASEAEARKLRLHAERLKAYKQPEQIGEVDIHKEIVSEQQTLNVPVSHEEVVIERRSLAEDAAVAEESIGEGETIRIPIQGERVDIAKETVPTEEIEIRKREVQENRQFSDTVRHEEARLENRGNIPIINAERDQPSSQPQV